MTESRINRLSWQEYFMTLAYITALRSPDPNTQVGCVITTWDNKIISTGYNGLPSAMGNGSIDWARKGEFLETKYPFVIHAEQNALLQIRDSWDVHGSKLYTTLYPCHECMKLIVQAGIDFIYYAEDKYHNTESAQASRKILELSGMRSNIEQIKLNKEKILKFIDGIIKV